MRVDVLDFELPSELIAQRPASEREQSRLMVLPRTGQSPLDRRVADLPDLLPAGALLVVNDTRVISARLMARKVNTHGQVELLLVRCDEARDIVLADGPTQGVQVWQALGRGNKPLRAGMDFEVLPRGAPAEGPPVLMARLLRTAQDGKLHEVALWTPDGAPVETRLSECGRVPLPPYIRREDGPEDRERYQTVYARRHGAIAAPTAGLHFTDALFERLKERGCKIASVTLHVGLGTFEPVVVDDLDQHVMHAEHYEIPPETVDAIRHARERQAPVVAVGTTSARALESAADPRNPGFVVGASGETRLLIQPGYRWQIVDGLFTNFHVPRSTLLAMVCSFAGIDRVLGAYRRAIHERYRFFSYGDAMLLWSSG